MTEKLVALLKEKAYKIATAESCTGGLLSSKITDVSGASEVFDMGIISYSNTVKAKYLNVPEDILKTHGAVSSETAEKMAEGIALAAGADIGVGITGIAGPSGGSIQKPVGLVFFAIYIKKEKKSKVFKLLLSGTRSEIKEETCNTVITELISILN